jgi:hypothetical protein
VTDSDFAADRNVKRCAELAHPLVAEAAETLTECSHGHALDRVEGDG